MSGDDFADTAVIVALGSNLKGRFKSSEALLEAALAQFAASGLKVVARSSWWKSAAWPDPAGPEYRNGVAIVETRLSPPDTLVALHRIERAFGREREGENRARTLDLDLIAHGRAILESGEMTIPHPRAHDRLFVMGPLAELLPGWRHPVTGKTAESLANSASVGRDAAPTALHNR
jgi:2-amino-4-hydroxy-6-hydroxymethyldihydropteridine diphosphokinase